MIRLDPCDGAECPRCGCRDTRMLRPAQADGWFARRGEARCCHCGMRFAFSPEACATPGLPPAAAEPPEEPDDSPEPAAQPASQPNAAVRYVLVRCPACGSSDTAITRTARPIRYHKCRACDHSFKSVEG